MPPISNPPSLGVVRIDALVMALDKLGLNVQIDAVLDAVKRSEEERDTKSAAPSAAAKRAALVKLSQEMPPPSGRSTLSYTSIFVPKSPPSVDPKSKERRKRLRAMTEEAFPPGKPLPNPYTSIWVTSRTDDTAVNKLPFITATCTVKPLDDDSDTPPSNVFSEALCLWDTGAQTSYVLSSSLSPEVRGGQQSGTAYMDIKIDGINRVIESVVAFRPTLPNGTSFIILGQHAFLNRLQYQVQPAAVNPDLSKTYPQAYGQLELVSYADPADDTVVTL